MGYRVLGMSHSGWDMPGAFDLSGLASTPFLPSDVSGLVGYYTTSDTASVTTVSGAVSEFADTYGVGPSLVQANASQRPTFNVANAATGGNDAVLSSNLKGLSWDIPISVKYLMVAHQSNSIQGLSFVITGTYHVGVASGYPYLGVSSSDVAAKRNGVLLPIDPTIPSHVFLPVTDYAVSAIELLNATSTAAHFMWNGYNRTLGGPYTDVLAFSTVPSAEEQASLLAFLNNVTGI